MEDNPRKAIIEIRELLDKPVYTIEGDYVGKVIDLVMSGLNISKIIVSYENPNLIPPEINEDGKPLGIPYSWIYGIGDAIILAVFPKLSAKSKSGE